MHYQLLSTTNLPNKEGQQFVAIYEYNGKPWSSVYMAKGDDEYLQYHSASDAFLATAFFPWDLFPTKYTLVIGVNDE